MLLADAVACTPASTSCKTALLMQEVAEEYVLAYIPRLPLPEWGSVQNAVSVWRYGARDTPPGTRGHTREILVGGLSEALGSDRLDHSSPPSGGAVHQ